MEELVQNQNELIEKKQQLIQEKKEIDKALRLFWNKLSEVCRELEQITTEIENRELIEGVANIEGFDLLSDEEIKLIISKMDKTDYRKHGDYPRYIDLERICKDVIHTKKLDPQHPAWTLTNVEICEKKEDTIPPRTTYKYVYTRIMYTPDIKYSSRDSSHKNYKTVYKRIDKSSSSSSL